MSPAAGQRPRKAVRQSERELVAGQTQRGRQCDQREIGLDDIDLQLVDTVRSAARRASVGRDDGEHATHLSVPRAAEHGAGERVTPRGLGHELHRDRLVAGTDPRVDAEIGDRETVRHVDRPNRQADRVTLGDLYLRRGEAEPLRGHLEGLQRVSGSARFVADGRRRHPRRDPHEERHHDTPMSLLLHVDLLRSRQPSIASNVGRIGAWMGFATV